MTAIDERESVVRPVEPWEEWEAMSSDQLAGEVRRFAAPLLEDPAMRDDFYRALAAKPLERLTDFDLPMDTGVLWFEKDETGHSGRAYKLRGAYWNIRAQLADNPNIKQVHCASTGNHGRGVIEACHRLNEQFGYCLQPVVHVPRDISRVKRDALMAAGATIVEADSFEEAHTATGEYRKLAELPGSDMAVVEAYDDPRTMAGQASCGYEIVADLLGGILDRNGANLLIDDITLWVPGGGGGFSAGCAVALDHFKKLGHIGPNVRVVVAQMEGCDALAREYRGHQPLTTEALDKSADATALLKGGTLTQRIIADGRFVADVVSVPKRYVGLAMEILERKHGYGIEPAGALALAGSLWYEDALACERTGSRRVHVSVTSGANVTEETKSEFAATVPQLRRERFARESVRHLHRRLSKLEEVLARKRGGAVLSKLRVANGATSLN